MAETVRKTLLNINFIFQKVKFLRIIRYLSLSLGIAMSLFALLVLFDNLTRKEETNTPLRAVLYLQNEIERTEQFRVDYDAPYAIIFALNSGKSRNDFNSDSTNVNKIKIKWIVESNGKTIDEGVENTHKFYSNIYLNVVELKSDITYKLKLIIENVPSQLISTSCYIVVSAYGAASKRPALSHELGPFLLKWSILTALLFLSIYAVLTIIFRIGLRKKY